jgi:hypothetical protein
MQPEPPPPSPFDIIRNKVEEANNPRATIGVNKIEVETQSGCRTILPSDSGIEVHEEGRVSGYMKTQDGKWQWTGSKSPGAVIFPGQPTPLSDDQVVDVVLKD